MCKVEKFIEPNPYKHNQRPIYYEENSNGCFICKSHRLDRDGYGRIDRGGREWLMHRYIYSIVYQVIIPPRMVIMHQCDNPSCLNPNHLKLGTQAENMRHKKERNRPMKVGHKLNESEIKEIVESDFTIEKLALDFDVCHTTIIRTKSRNKIDSERKRVGDKPCIKSENKIHKKINASNK